jgi:murein tripeptide amidase MpaA
MRNAFLILIFSAISGIGPGAQGSEFQTEYELSGGLQTPRYAQTRTTALQLAEISDQITYTTFGRSPQGRDLMLLIADRDGASSPSDVRASGRAVLMIQACIHAGESDGKDAGLMLLRDIATHKLAPSLLDNVTILFLPIFNVDGHEHFGPLNRPNQNGPLEMGFRVTANNLNLNRDFVKADAPEMQAWLDLYSAWMPDFLIDAHVSDGADFQYTLMYDMPVRGNMEAGLSLVTPGCLSQGSAVISHQAGPAAHALWRFSALARPPQRYQCLDQWSTLHPWLHGCSKPPRPAARNSCPERLRHPG